MSSGKANPQQKTENSFEMEVVTSYTLNFMIYLHNIYLNQQDDDFKFPYLSKQLHFKESFTERFKALWEEVTERIFNAGETADIKCFFDESEMFYNQLLEKDLENLVTYHEVHAAFQTWWDSFVGKFTLERSVDAAAHQLYKDLVRAFIEKEEVPAERLRIHLIYDECTFTEATEFSYFVVVPVQEFSLRKDELIPRIKKVLTCKGQE